MDAVIMALFTLPHALSLAYFWYRRSVDCICSLLCAVVLPIYEVMELIGIRVKHPPVYALILAGVRPPEPADRGAAPRTVTEDSSLGGAIES